MYRLKIAAVATALFFLSGCTSFTVNVGDLIEPPILSKEQAEITEALKLALNTTQFKLKYPKYGENRSAIIFKDIDADQEEEVIVFYEQSLDSSDTARINIMDKVGGKWISVYDVPGNGEEIEFISFTNITDEKKSDIIIGWKTSPKTDKYVLNAYTYSNNSLKNMLNVKYDSMKIIASDENHKLSSIMILNYKTSDPTVKLIKEVSKYKLGVVGVARLNRNVEEVINISSGRLASGNHAVFIDEQLTDESVSTEIVTYKNNSVVNLMLSEEYEPNNLFFEALRNEFLLSEDINGDGVLDIPSQRLMAGYEGREDEEDSEEEYEDVYLTEYKTLSEGVFKKLQTAVVNKEEGYKIIFPEKWQNDRVIVKIQPGRGGYSFAVFDETFEKSQSELLQIYVYAKDDYKDLFEMEQFRLIATKGNFEYYGYIPENADSKMGITYEELEKMFVLL